MEKSIEHIRLEQAFEELRVQLEEANDVIEAIRSGEVDALVVNGKDGHQLYTLKTADHTYRIFIEQMTESALTLDETGLILYCNSRFAETFGLALEKVIGMRFLDFVPVKDTNTAKRIIDSAWKVDTKVELDLQYDNNPSIPVQLSLKALNLDEGTALSVIVTDLSEVKKNQLLLQTRNTELEQARRIADELNENLELTVQQRTLELQAKNKELEVANSIQLEINKQLNIALDSLKESDDKLHSAFNAGDLGSCNIDLRTGKTEMSERFRQLHGLPLTGETNWEMLLSVVENDFQPTMSKMLLDCEDLGLDIDMTYPIKHPVSGHRRWMRIVGKAKKDSSGNCESVYAVLMDVTAQKQDEQRKNDFIAMVSHELKTPLTSMKGYVQIIQKKAVFENTSFVDKALEGAGRQINKMTEMIDGFLNISRLESGKMVMDFQKVQLSEIVDEVVEEYRTTISSHFITVTGTSGIIVKADRGKLGHVISNLISNAIKYSPAKSSIQINFFSKGEEAICTIKDEGMGIEKNDLPKLFDRFYRVENSLMGNVTGFGIGLYLSAEIIARHKGKIWAESELGKGSIFSFAIPLAH